MLIENGYHYRTLDVVVRLSALYKKSWILIRLRHSDILYITLYHKYLTKVLHNACGKPVENLWKTLLFPPFILVIIEVKPLFHS